MSPLVQITARRLEDANTISEPVMTYCQLDAAKEHIWMKFYLKFKYLHSRKSTSKSRLENGRHFVSAPMWSLITGFMDYYSTAHKVVSILGKTVHQLCFRFHISWNFITQFVDFRRYQGINSHSIGQFRLEYSIFCCIFSLFHGNLWHFKRKISKLPLWLRMECSDLFSDNIGKFIST